MTNAELRAALDEYAVALVPDIRAPIGSHNYQDLLTFNPLFHGLLHPDLNSRLAPMKAALAGNDSDDARRLLAAALVELQGPVGAAEAMFRERISPDISQSNCVTCHVAGGQAGSTRHILERTSNSNHLQANLTMYARLVGSVGVNTIVSKARGGSGHGGRVRLSAGSDELEDLETFLNLL